MNKRLLQSRMVLESDNQIELSKALGITPQTLSAKINGTDGAEFKQSEIVAIKNRYCLTPDLVDQIFFA